VTTPFPCHSMTLPSPALRILEHLRLVPERTQSGLRKRKRPGYLTGRPRRREQPELQGFFPRGGPLKTRPK